MDSSSVTFNASPGVLKQAERQLAMVLAPVAICAAVGMLLAEFGHYLLGPQSPFLGFSIGSHALLLIVAVFYLGRPISRANIWGLALYGYCATFSGLSLWLFERYGNFLHLGILSVAAFYFLVDRRYLLVSQLYGSLWLLVGIAVIWSDESWRGSMLAAFMCWMAGLAIHIGRVRIMEELEQTRQALQREQQERRRAEDLSVLARQRENLGAMVGGVAHDFNNLLTGIVGGIDLARSSGNDETTRTQALSVAAEASTAAQELCSTLLGYTKGEPVQSVSFDVRDCVEEAVRHARISLPAGIQLTETLTSVAACATGDPVRIRQAVINLLINAAQVSRGHVAVRTDTRRLNDIAHAVVTVSDDGRGITERVRQRMFNPFFTTKPDGKGLGLAAVATTIDSHGGAINVDSDQSGTRIELLIPLERAAYASDSSTAQQIPSAADAVEMSDRDVGVTLVPAQSLGTVLATVFDQYPYLIFYKDTNNQTLRVNHAVAELRGLTPQAMANTPADLFHPDEANDYYQDDLRVIASKQPRLNIRELIEISPGVKRWFRTDKHPTFNEHGQVDGILVFSQALPDQNHGQAHSPSVVPLGAGATKAAADPTAASSDDQESNSRISPQSGLLA